MEIDFKIFNINDNRNNRIYTKEAVKNAIDDWKKENNINSCLGQITKNTYNELSLQNISHRIDDIELKDDDLYCKITTLELKQGRELESLLKNNKINIKPCIWFCPEDWNETVDEQGNTVITKCKIKRIDLEVV